MNVVSIISVIIAGVSALIAGISMHRNSKKDSQRDASELTTVIVKLENIGSDIRDIKTDMHEVKADLKNHAERLTIVEQQVKELHHYVYGKHP